MSRTGSPVGVAVPGPPVASPPLPGFSGPGRPVLSWFEVPHAARPIAAAAPTPAPRSPLRVIPLISRMPSPFALTYELNVIQTDKQ